MTKEELAKLKEEKATLRTEILLANSTLMQAQIKVDELKRRYCKLDRLIANEERLTILEPSGIGKKVRKFCGMTKKELLKLVDELPDEWEEEEEDNES